MALTAFVDLSTKKISVSETPMDILTMYLGSRGYAAKILYDNVGPEVEPLSEENYLIFSTGPFTGTPWPTSARYTVTAKSPLTGIYGYSNSSGFFGPELRKAGFDVLIFTGKSDKPVMLVIEDASISLEDAGELWGLTTDKTEKILRARYEGSRVASIGPAGENLVKISSVINDYGRAAARTGMGAVMGYKKLKAIVVRSSREVPITPAFKKIALKMMGKTGKHPGSKNLRKWGTVHLVDPKNMVGDLPTKNHRYGQFDRADRINARSLNRYLEKNDGCFACPIRCSRFTRVKEGKYRARTEGPEYETTNAFGPLVYNDNMEVIIYANLLCNRYGMDTISTGAAIAFAMECHENGLLSDPEDKISLKWGDEDTIVKLIEKIAFREGIGDLLAEGVREASKKLGKGAERYAMHVKGLEMPMQEPRVTKGMALGHSTSNRGADHLYALPTIDLAGNVEAGEKLFPDLMPKIMEPTDETYKPEMVVYTEACSAIADSLGICKFSTIENYALYTEDIVAGLNELPGYDYDEETLLQAGERIVNLERMYNCRLGLNRKDDQLPDRFLTEKMMVLDIETGRVIKDGLTVNLRYMLDKYYSLRGWSKNGVPTRAKLESLGLGWLTDDLRDT